MKRIVICLLLLCICFGIKAQKLTLKSVSPLPMDLSVQNNPNPRRDQNGTPCALIRVGVVGVEDLTFPDAVGNVKRSLSEYMVYVPAGLKTLQYKNQSGSITGSVSFEDNDIDEIESKSVYSVVFESDSHLRAAIFSVEPKTATLTFDGKPVKLDAEGMAVITKPIGKYQYNVQANEYELQSGAVSLTEDDISTTTNVILRPKQYPLTIKCTPANAVLFIDNVSFGALNKIPNLQITGGKHSIRLTASGYEDLEQDIQVAGAPVTLNLSLTKMAEELVVHKDERTRTKVSLPPYYYLSIGGQIFDKKQYLGHDWAIKGSFGAMQHFAGVVALYEGISASVMNLKKDLKDEWFEHPADSANSWAIEVPLMVGVSVPFGKYNKNMFTVLGGGYGKAIFTEISKPDKDNSSDPHGNSNKTNWDYGLRGMVILDISRFTIQAEVGLSLAKFEKYKTSSNSSTSAKTTSTTVKTDGKNKPNLFFGITLGTRLGRLKIWD